MRLMLCTDVQKRLRQGEVPAEGTDLHSHIQGCSTCARVDAEQIRAAIDATAAKPLRLGTRTGTEIDQLARTREGIAELIANGPVRSIAEDIAAAAVTHRTRSGRPNALLHKARNRAGLAGVRRH